MHMGYLTLTIALGIVVLLGFWSRSRRRKIEKRLSSKVPKVYPLSRAKSQTKLRRIK